MNTVRNLLISSVCTIAIAFNSPAQSDVHANIPDSIGTREFTVAPLQVEGEIENPGVVDLSTLPIRSVSVKELGLNESGKQQFKGAFSYTGYSLYDILKTVKVKKTNEKEFSPSTDLFIVVENDKNQRAVFSWGEIFSARAHFQILVSKTVDAINPSKLKAHWPLPSEARLICADDLHDVRFILHPKRIIVRSFSGSFATEKPKDMYSPEISVAMGSQSFKVGEIGASIERRKYSSVGYGHGMGYKGVQSVDGYLLKDIISGIIQLNPADVRTSIAVVSAKDGYRAVFSVSEIFNRNDNQDFLLVDQKDSNKDGRYSLFASPDFFVDRNVKAIEKFEIVRMN
jgi:hypothetical protein